MSGEQLEAYSLFVASYPFIAHPSIPAINNCRWMTSHICRMHTWKLRDCPHSNKSPRMGVGTVINPEWTFLPKQDITYPLAVYLIMFTEPWVDQQSAEGERMLEKVQEKGRSRVHFSHPEALSSIEGLLVGQCHHNFWILSGWKASSFHSAVFHF